MQHKRKITGMVSERVRTFIQAEAVLVIAALIALVSMAILPPTPANLPTYLGYIDFRTIGLLFCLMTVVAGLTRAGLLSAIRRRLATGQNTMRKLALLLTIISFLLAMIVTNDVALISFVPLTLLLFRTAPRRALVVTLVAQTVAANLGSMLTPIGNPQNIYLYSTYNMDFSAFITTIAPYGVIGLLASLTPCLLVPNKPITCSELAEVNINKRLLFGYTALFALALACVARLLPWETCTVITIITCLVIDRGVLKSVDYSLLATFACFFIFVGNINHIESLVTMLQSTLMGREILVSALASQVMSNVPAAIMLSGFTTNAADLLIGTNIGGLGTPVASLASLITLRLYARSANAHTAYYLGWFSLINITLLLMFLLLSFVLG